jgi:hypothetical protein
MKFAKLIYIGLLTLFLLQGVDLRRSEAQQSNPPPSGALGQDQRKDACRRDPSITFDQEQVRELEKLQRAYLEEIRPIWNEMRNLRLELRFAGSTPQTEPDSLFDKQRRLSSLQGQVETLSFVYRARVKSILTKEQWGRLPLDCPLKTGSSYGTGSGKWSPRGFR